MTDRLPSDANIDMAIQACREERSNVVQNKERMQVIKESLNDGYCDVSGQGGDLTLAGERNLSCDPNTFDHAGVGEMGRIRFYVSKGMLDEF